MNLMRESKFIVLHVGFASLLDILLSNLRRARRWIRVKMYGCTVSCRMDTVLSYAVL
jgi:hypothetical protein